MDTLNSITDPSERSTKRLKIDSMTSDEGGVHEKSPETESSLTHESDVLETKYKVFLSHSGMQKDFVEQLCIDLESYDRYPFFDKRRDCLPIGVKFPELIFDAIQQCQVGVLVISKEFFTKTKWPMLELVAMVSELKKPNSSIKIIPVFYNLSRKDWLDKKNRSKWILLWKEWANEDERININEWKMALEELKPINSLMMKDGEVKLREEIVHAVCESIHPETRWDDSHVQGKSRLCEIVMKKIHKQKQKNGIQVMGLYGMGGIGKTTICKVMCNEMFQKFHGRVCHTELESTTEVELLREVLRRFTKIRRELLAGLNIDECYDKLRRCIGKDPIFLAIDNVSDTPGARKQSKNLLGAKWGEGSAVIVTARSLVELTKLKPHIDDSACVEMPELKEYEARTLFLNNVGFDQDATIAIDQKTISSCVDRCNFFKGEGKRRHYIPLALEVLGEQLGGLGYDAEQWNKQVKNIDTFGQELSRKDTHPIFSILRTSYDRLSEEAQMLFMDAALFLPDVDPYFDWDFWTIFDWLSMVHGSSVDEIKRQLEGLKQKSLLKDLGDGRTRIVMHDLWREFCVAETKVGKFADRRWVFVEKGSPGPDCRWKSLKRMCFLNEGWRSLNGMDLDDFLDVSVLELRYRSSHLPASYELDLKGLKHLKSLELNSPSFNTKCVGFGSLTNLAYLSWISAIASSPDFEEIGRLTKLQVLHVEGFNGDKLPDLSMLTSLKKVYFRWCREVTTLTGLSSKLTNVKYLSLRKCFKLRECRGLGELYALEYLSLYDCRELKELPCLQLLTRLRELNICECRLLRSVPGLSDLVALELLWADRCYMLDNFPDLQKLTNLKKLHCRSCRALKSLTCTRPLLALEVINLTLCSSLEGLPDLSNFPQLEFLHLGGCTGLMKLTNGAPLRALSVLDLQGCSKLSALPDHLSSSTNLEALYVLKSGIMLHGDDIRKLMASCTRLVDPRSARSEYGIVISAVTGSDTDVRETELDDVEINVQNQCRSRRLPDSLPRDKVTRLIYAHAGGFLLALTSNGMHKLWNWGLEINVRGYFQQATVSCAPSLWLPASGKLMVNTINETSLEAVPSLALSNNDEYLISASGGRGFLYGIRSSKVMTTFKQYPPPAVTSLAFYPDDNNIIAMGMEDSTIEIYNIRVDEVLCMLEGHQKRVIDLAFSKSTNSMSMLVSLGADGQLCMWKGQEWSKRQSNFGPLLHDRRISCVEGIRVQIHGDQVHLLVVGKSQLTVYDALELNGPIFQWNVPQSPFTTAVSDATYSGDGHLVYASFVDGSVSIFNAKCLLPLCRLAAPIHRPRGEGGSKVYPLVIAANPYQPNQFALGMTDGCVLVVEPFESAWTEREWTWRPSALGDNGTISGVLSGPDSVAVQDDARVGQNEKMSRTKKSRRKRRALCKRSGNKPSTHLILRLFNKRVNRLLRIANHRKFFSVSHIRQH